MKVSEMMATIRERMVDRADPEDITSTVLFDWLNQAYLRIQRQSYFWSFLHSRGLIFSSVADTTTYSLPLVRTIDCSTTYAIQDGSSTRIPLHRGDYRFWIEENRYAAITTSQPCQIIEAPDDDWILYPTPNDVYAVYGDYWSQPSAFTNNASEPVWAEDLHPLVWMIALQTSLQRTQEQHFVESAVVEVTSNIPTMMDEMYRRYLSGFRGKR